MARNGNSNSESESRTRASNVATAGTTASAASRSNVKQRLTAAQQQYLRDLNRKHITNNHPDLIPRPDPVDFESYSDEFLRRYKDHYGIDARDNLTLPGYLLGSQIGSRTYSYRQNHPDNPHHRVTKRELASQVSRHFTAHTVKEADCIPQFIYKVKNQKRKFRIEFKG